MDKMHSRNSMCNPWICCHSGAGENLLAVDNDWPVLGLGMLVHNLYRGCNKTLCSAGYTDLSHPPPELQQSVAEWVGVAGPFSVVELDHLYSPV